MKHTSATSPCKSSDLRANKKPSWYKPWWRRAESNRRLPACKAGALPTEPRPHIFCGKLVTNVVGTGGLEPPTSRLSGVRSNHLSYAPTLPMACANGLGGLVSPKTASAVKGDYASYQEVSVPEDRTAHSETLMEGLLRKEVIQPHLPIRLPCYDLAPVISPTFGGSVLCRLGHRLRVLPASMA